MAVFRIEKTKDYTVMSNYHLKDSNLSLKSKGLLSMMLSLPEEWNYTTRGLVRLVKAVNVDNKTLTAILKAYAKGDFELPADIENNAQEDTDNEKQA